MARLPRPGVQQQRNRSCGGERNCLRSPHLALPPCHPTVAPKGAHPFQQESFTRSTACATARFRIQVTCQDDVARVRTSRHVKRVTAGTLRKKQAVDLELRGDSMCNGGTPAPANPTFSLVAPRSPAARAQRNDSHSLFMKQSRRRCIRSGLPNAPTRSAFAMRACRLRAYLLRSHHCGRLSREFTHLGRHVGRGHNCFTDKYSIRFPCPQTLEITRIANAAFADQHRPIADR